jgi:organic hydroperoxide reductase OsmC/OhrA
VGRAGGRAGREDEPRGAHRGGPFVVPGQGITKAALTVEGRVPGIDEDAFRAAAEDAKVNCPVSKALAGVPEITLDARLAG